MGCQLRLSAWPRKKLNTCELLFSQLLANRESAIIKKDKCLSSGPLESLRSVRQKPPNIQLRRSIWNFIHSLR
jgi:hypothetical protein